MKRVKWLLVSLPALVLSVSLLGLVSGCGEDASKSSSAPAMSPAVQNERNAMEKFYAEKAEKKKAASGPAAKK